MTSDMIATAPIPERLAEIGWTGDECVADEHMMVHYYRTTEDGRIAFGKGGCSHAYLGRITQAFEAGSRVARTEQSFRRIYPTLHDVPITHTWTGPIDRSETNSPFFGHLDRNPDILYGVGYSGTGVGPSYLGGRILASTALERHDEWQDSPINRGPRSLDPKTQFETSMAISSVRRCFAKKRASTQGEHRRRSLGCRTGSFRVDCASRARALQPV